jgi:hypothetical protein
MTDNEWDNIAFGDRIYSPELAKYAIVRGVVQHSIDGIIGIRVQWDGDDDNRQIHRDSTLGAFVEYAPDPITVYERLREEDP